MKRKILLILIIPFGLLGQVKTDSTSVNKTNKMLYEEEKNEQYAGLGRAASAIFNSDKRFNISGFGESNFVNHIESNNPSLGDLELYYTQLYRFSTFFGFKITDKVIFNSELLVEHIRDGSENETKITPEAYIDARFNKNFGIRMGYVPLVIGYINSNDEPVLFHSVNRPEVERLIIPTTWVGIGATVYGQVLPGLDYFLGVFSSPDAEEFISPTFIRGGAEPKFEVPKSLGVNYQLLYTRIEGLQTGISGFIGNTGQGHKFVNDNGDTEDLNSLLNLTSAFVRYDFSNVRLIAMGTYSSLSNTENIYRLTEEQNKAQVIGEQVYGYYGELGINMLHYFNIDRSAHGKFWNKKEMELPIFVRYERLNSHYKVNKSLIEKNYLYSNLEILSIGLNFKPNEDFVLKVNYQFRENKGAINIEPESNLLELGIGFSY